jgi:hypothetical protein
MLANDDHNNVPSDLKTKECPAAALAHHAVIKPELLVLATHHDQMHKHDHDT